MKTGHTDLGGYGLTASAKRGDRRLILVINGLQSMQARADESARLLYWGFNEFEDYPLFKQGETVEAANVWLGGSATVPLVPARDVVVTMNRDERRSLTVKVVMPEAVPAPVAKGATVGKLVLSAPNFVTEEIPLLAGADVGRIGLIGRIGVSAKHFVLGRAG